MPPPSRPWCWWRILQFRRGWPDAPDVDSISDDNRKLARQLLAAADLWVFVTTANRYADAVPWKLLLDAASRDIMVAMLNGNVSALAARVTGMAQAADEQQPIFEFGRSCLAFGALTTADRVAELQERARAGLT